MDEQTGFTGFLTKYFSLNPARPGQTLVNALICYPLALGTIGVAVYGNPLSRISNSIGSGGSRMVGGVINENREGLQEASNSLYGRPTQPGDLNRRQPQRQQLQCDGGWCFPSSR